MSIDPTPLDALLSVSDEGLALIDGQGTVRYVSPALAGLLGRTYTELVGANVFDLVHPTEIEQAVAALRYRLDESGDQLPRTLRLLHAAGHWVPVEVGGQVRELGGQAVVAIRVVPVATGSALLQWKTRASASELVVRQAFTLMAAQPSTVMTAVSDVVEQLARFVAAHGAAVFVETPGGLEFQSGWRLGREVYERIGRIGSETPALESIRGRLNEHGYSVIQDHREAPGHEALAAIGVRSSMLVSFPYRGGLGFIVLWRTDVRPWSDDALRVSRSCATLIGQALVKGDSDERFARAFDEGPVGFGMISWSGEVLDSNRQLREQFGTDETVGVTLLDRVHADDRDMVRAAVHALKERRTERTVLTLRVTGPNDEARVLRSHVCRLGDDTVRSCVFVLVEDITELTRQREELEANERRSRELVASIPAFVARLDRAGRILMCGPEIANRGVRPEDLIGRQIGEVFDGVVDTPFWSRLMDVFNHGERFEEQFAFELPDGPLVVEVRSVPEFTADGSVESLLILALDVTDSRAMAARLAYNAAHDPLTGALNRDTLLDRLQHTLESVPGRGASLLFLDLDRFKVVNDSMGHAAGDELLRLAVDRIREHVRADDVVARIGGDEFVVLLPDADSTAAAALAERVRDGFERPFSIFGVDVRQTVSVGVAVHEDPGVQAVADLLGQADLAMYEAKQRGRNRREMFDDRMRSRLEARTTLEQELRTAIVREELMVHYQPEVELLSRQIVGVEALLRWDHPTRGLLPAAEFIDVAEDAGLIHDLGRFVLTRASADVATLAAGQNRLTLRVNVSAREFVRGNLAADVADALAASGFAASALCLEVTEHTIMSDPELADRQIEELRSLGVKFAIDDFGVGYSSLAQLKRFAMDAVKIDRSFVADLPGARDSRAIVGSILGLARALSLDVVAEGVETEEQARCLRLLGCERAQGYLFGRAMPIDDLSRFVAG